MAALSVHRHPDAGAFLSRAEPWLLRREAENNLILGLARRLVAGPGPYRPPIYLATVEAEGEVVGCAFRTPPLKLGLTRMPPAALPLLADDVAQVYVQLPAVLGPAAEARAFAEAWRALKGTPVRPGMRQRIYRLEEVREPGPRPSGRFRVATPEDSELVERWLEEFTREAAVAGHGLRALARERLAAGAVGLWTDPEPRSMAGRSGDTPNGARVGYVYTPPEWRGRGYAGACVAELSRRILADGRRFCFLYTDLANPTSNALYGRIGYEPVCDVMDILFEGSSVP